VRYDHSNQPNTQTRLLTDRAAPASESSCRRPSSDRDALPHRVRPPPPFLTAPPGCDASSSGRDASSSGRAASSLGRAAWLRRPLVARAHGAAPSGSWTRGCRLSGRDASSSGRAASSLGRAAWLRQPLVARAHGAEPSGSWTRRRRLSGAAVWPWTRVGHLLSWARSLPTGSPVHQS
jgi:hypothetical protein